MTTAGGDFGKHVAAALRARRISQRKAAALMNFDQAYLNRVLNGKQTPSPEFATALDNLLGAEGTLVALAAVLNEDEEKRLEYSLAQPTRLDLRSVQALAEVLSAQRRADDKLGPAPMIPGIETQIITNSGLLRAARGPARDALADVVAEYVQFGGWLYSSARTDDARAVQLLNEASELADEADSGPLAAQALNFRGYLARQQGRPRAAARWFSAAYLTPGAHPAQRMGDAAQAAQGYAELGQRDEAKRLLEEAADLADRAAAETPPGTAYWLTPSFQRLNLGLAHLGLGEAAAAADHLSAGLSGLPPEQQGAEWGREYQEALAEALQRR